MCVRGPCATFNSLLMLTISPKLPLGNSGHWTLNCCDELVDIASDDEAICSSRLSQVVLDESVHSWPATDSRVTSFDIKDVSKLDVLIFPPLSIIEFYGDSKSQKLALIFRPMKNSTLRAGASRVLRSQRPWTSLFQSTCVTGCQKKVWMRELLFSLSGFRRKVWI